MTISTVLIWFLIATAIVVAIPSMWMVCYALAPTRTQDYRDTASCGVIPNLLIGLIPAVVTFFGVAAILQARKGPAVGLVLAVAGLVLMWSLMGAGGIALLVGDLTTVKSIRLTSNIRYDDLIPFFPLKKYLKNKA